MVGLNMFFFFKKNENGTFNLAEIYGDRKGNLTTKSFYNTKKEASQRVNEIKTSLHSTSVTEGASSSSGAKIPRLLETAKGNVSFHKASPVFYSNAEKAVEGLKQEKATPAQWLAMLQKQGGLKAAEDKWLGLSEWLESSDAKTLTKQEVLDFIRENEVKLEEVAYAENPKGFEELKAEQQIVVDVFTGRKNRMGIQIPRDEGISVGIELQQGNENHAGTKHSIHRHYATRSGYYTAEEILSIPDIIKNGNRQETTLDNGKTGYVYQTEKYGVRYTVLTAGRGDKEVFNDFYTKKTPPKMTYMPKATRT